MGNTMAISQCLTWNPLQLASSHDRRCPSIAKRHSLQPAQRPASVQAFLAQHASPPRRRRAQPPAALSFYAESAVQATSAQGMISQLIALCCVAGLAFYLANQPDTVRVHHTQQPPVDA